MLSSNSTLVLRAENQRVCYGSDLESQTDLRNELDFKVLSDSFETYPEMGTICKRLKLTRSGLGLWMRHLMC
jgi:hypothetical protein